jgi:nucleotide-binding universal stress UspA family protein
MKILLAVDSSEYSAAAIKEVAKRPWPARSTVRVLSVVEPFPAIAVEPWYGGRESLETLDREMRRRAQNLTKKTVDRLKAKDLKVEALIRTGNPASEIVDEALKWSADLIVLGSHGYTGVKRIFLGSIALSVVAHAPCSVEVVRRKHSTKSR